MTEHADAPRVLEHTIEVPLDHARPDGPVVDLFVREVVAPGGEDRPYLLFLQGGPGGEPPMPQTRPVSPGWLARALRDFRVLLLDQRGTGRSAPLVDLDGDDAAPSRPTHLTLFRADAIVADAEVLRRHLGIERWSLLGQSFGGFCAFTYLSRAPEALAAVYLTGGVPPVGHGPETVYPRTYATMAAAQPWRTGRDHPNDRGRYRRLLERCDAGQVLLPHGEAFTAHRLRHTGQVLGMSYGARDPARSAGARPGALRRSATTSSPRPPTPGAARSTRCCSTPPPPTAR